MRRLLRLVPALGLTACLGSTGTDTGGVTELGPADLRLLWIGNSLTFSNDLPAVLQDLAEADGRTVAYASLLQPDFSLEDHWARGAASAIAGLAADHVILQQGPSSLPSSQEHLRYWAGRMADPIRAAGGVPALFMVWPPTSRSEAYDDVARSYRAAAAAVDGLLLPAGEAMRSPRVDGLALLEADGFHPSPLGTLLAALTLYGALTWDGSGAPACPVHGAGGVDPEVGERLCAAARDAVTGSSRSGAP